MSTPESGGAAPPGKKLAAADEDVLSVLFERWDVLAEDEDILPPLSPLASKLLAVEHEDAEAITELTQIVESDPVLTGRILGLANLNDNVKQRVAIYQAIIAEHASSQQNRDYAHSTR